MRIAYYSMSGNVRDFIQWRMDDLDTVDIEDWGNADEPYVLITPTYEFGQVPEVVTEWLRDNSDNLRGVIASGNRNWGKNYGKAGDIIADMYDVPLLGKFELKGTGREASVLRSALYDLGAIK